MLVRVPHGVWDWFGWPSATAARFVLLRTSKGSQGKPRQAKAPVAAATQSSAHIKVEDEGQREGSTKHPSAPSPSAPTPAGCAAARNTMVTKKE